VNFGGRQIEYDGVRLPFFLSGWRIGRRRYAPGDNVTNSASTTYTELEDLEPKQLTLTDIEPLPSFR
jgi:hypothetical protein